MSGFEKTDVEEELKFIENLHRLGDDQSVNHLARGLLLSETLTKEQKKRIRKVLKGDTLGASVVTTLIVLALIVAFFLYIKYAT